MRCLRNYFLAFNLPIFLVAAALVISPPLFADGKLSSDRPNSQATPPPHTEPTPASVFGNYAGAGKCAPGSPKPCTDTGVMDNVFIQPFVKPETEDDVLVRGILGQEKTDARVAIRILRDHGHSCTLEGAMFWSKDHLEFQDEPPAARTVYSKCQMQLWVKDGTMTIKDPGNECSEKFCSLDILMRLEGRRFQKGPDQLLAAYKKSATPPPASIFGTYNGTGKSATDERKKSSREDLSAKHNIVIKPSDTADVRLVIEGPSCRMDADAMWLGNHLAFLKEMPDSPGRPQLLQFWFKDNTVVSTDVWNNHCGASIQGGYFKKSPTPPGRDTQR